MIDATCSCTAAHRMRCQPPLTDECSCVELHPNACVLLNSLQQLNLKQFWTELILLLPFVLLQLLRTMQGVLNHHHPRTHLGDSQCWAPLVLQDVQADASLAVHVGVVHLGLESNLQQRTSHSWHAKCPALALTRCIKHLQNTNTTLTAALRTFGGLNG